MPDASLQLEMLPQPDDSTCGPTCLHAVYRFYGDAVPLVDVIGGAGRLDDGGTLAVYLGLHALRRGYRARLYTYDLQVFDPTWFGPDVDLEAKLRSQAAVKRIPKLGIATDAYIEFLQLGGELRMEVLTVGLIRKYLKRSMPILTGLSATFLYGEARELYSVDGPTGHSVEADDVRGYPSGHFVVLCGYNPEERSVLVADPLESNPIAGDHLYAIDIDRVFSAIMLGVVTYDANLLVISPAHASGKGNRDARTDRG